MADITSLTNPEIKHIVKLHDAKERRNYGLCLVEGERTTYTFLQSNIQLIKMYVTEDNKDNALKLIRSAKKIQDINENLITTVSYDVMKKISTATTPSGYLALFSIPQKPTLDKLTAGLVLAQISDPGNMGTLIRTAVSCGIKSVVIIEGTDPWSPKVIQASAGTISWVNIFQMDWNSLVSAKNSLELCALVVSGGMTLDKIKSKNALLIVGNEAHGVPKEWQKQCDHLVSIPMPGGTESLNAAIAGSIGMYLLFVKS